MNGYFKSNGLMRVNRHWQNSIFKPNTSFNPGGNFVLNDSLYSTYTYFGLSVDGLIKETINYEDATGRYTIFKCDKYFGFNPSESSSYYNNIFSNGESSGLWYSKKVNNRYVRANGYPVRITGTYVRRDGNPINIPETQWDVPRSLGELRSRLNIIASKYPINSNDSLSSLSNKTKQTEEYFKNYTLTNFVAEQPTVISHKSHSGDYYLGITYESKSGILTNGYVYISMALEEQDTIRLHTLFPYASSSEGISAYKIYYNPTADNYYSFKDISEKIHIADLLKPTGGVMNPLLEGKPYKVPITAEKLSHIAYDASSPFSGYGMSGVFFKGTLSYFGNQKMQGD